MANTHGWVKWQTESLSLNVVAFLPAEPKAQSELTVYFEGDGFAWLNSSTPSSDPTPINPIGLRLALAQSHGNAAYIARPCQYTQAPSYRCDQALWTNRRFSPEVIDAIQNALDGVKKRFAAEHLTLVGYSGGGAIAALVAARRNDVVKLVTVAGNLDTDAWVMLHHLSPLTGSMNPADEVERLAFVEQLHLVGDIDEIVPKALIERYIARYPEGHRPQIRIVKNADHTCCWQDHWDELLQSE